MAMPWRCLCCWVKVHDSDELAFWFCTSFVERGMSHHHGAIEVVLDKVMKFGVSPCLENEGKA
jgi:hypothetical protein